MVHKVLIVGGGCAGLAAGIYTARAEYNPIIFAGTLEDKGGLLTKTSVVENYPGFPDGIEGYDLIANMETQAKKYGADVIDEEIVRVDFSQLPFKLIRCACTTYEAETVIIATGSKPLRLGLENKISFGVQELALAVFVMGLCIKTKKSTL